MTGSASFVKFQQGYGKTTLIHLNTTLDTSLIIDKAFDNKHVFHRMITLCSCGLARLMIAFRNTLSEHLSKLTPLRSKAQAKSANKSFNSTIPHQHFQYEVDATLCYRPASAGLENSLTLLLAAPSRTTVVHTDPV